MLLSVLRVTASVNPGQKRVIFVSSIACFSQDCGTLCNQGNSNGTLLAWSFQVFSTSFFSWKVWWPFLTPFHNRTISCDPDLPARHLHEELCSWENLIQKTTRALFWHGTQCLTNIFQSKVGAPSL